MNESDFANLVEQYSSLIFTVCFRLVRDYQEAENLTQDTFLTAFLSIDRFTGTNYKPWLIRIAVNKSKDYLKSAYHRTTNAVDNQTLDTIQNDKTNYGLIEETEQLETIKAACRKLPPPYCEIALLHYVEDKSFEEIANILDRPLKTVQTQAYRARDKLRKKLKEDMVC
ncbi:MAG: RNA polymerase sigma factor [Oscillospiraceae bacterium]|jgi:RNA polymerase sigma-70 factor (ECF subfamily)|nr:RNA polymerase sigma factor [Oscillospiraceae bacterium]